MNGGRKKAASRLKVEDKVRIPPFRAASRNAPVISEKWIRTIAERVLYEDSHLLVIDKPAGIAVHSGSGLKFGVIDVLKQVYGETLELAHRLDKDTSGCLLVAKSAVVCRQLQEMFRNGTVTKQYHCLVKGRLTLAEISCDARLTTQRQEEGEAKTKVDPSGKTARTNFRLMQNFRLNGADCALLDVSIETGRTHQIRVHAKHLGHPIAGDRRYGDPAFNSLVAKWSLPRMYLHASRLQFSHPIEQGTLDVQAPPPLDCANFLAHLKTG